MVMMLATPGPGTVAFGSLNSKTIDILPILRGVAGKVVAPANCIAAVDADSDVLDSTKQLSSRKALYRQLNEA